MTHPFSLPSRAEAEALLEEAALLNPGPWVQHSRYAAQAAERIAAAHPALEPEPAYIMGLLHDIGRRVGVTDMRHAIDGYHFMMRLGYADSARICLTHSFPVQTVYAHSGQWDCTPEELAWADAALSGIVYDDYDRLIQLCDCVSLPTGFCLMEQRFVDVVLRRGFNDRTVEKWRAFLGIKEQFEQEIKVSINQLFDLMN